MTIASFLAAAATLTSAFAEPMERELTLKESTEVWSQTVCLGELVSEGWVKSRCAVERSTCCRWTLGGATGRTMRRADLQRELAKMSFGGFLLRLRGAEQISVTQTRRELRSEEIQAKIVDAIKAKVLADAVEASVSVLKVQSPAYVALDNESAWDVVLPEQLVERANVKIVSLADGGQQIGWAQATIKIEAEAYIAKRAIRPGEALKLDDFELKPFNVLSPAVAGQMVFKKGQFPEAVRARQTILAGAALSATVIERIPMVKLGDTVTLILRSDNLRISTKAVVQGSAALGDMVTVQLSRYNRTFRGRLVEGRLVEVWL